MSELKRCPFCGGEAKIDCNNRFSDWFVRCTKCFCKTPAFLNEFMARVAWNTRKPVERILERLVETESYSRSPQFSKAVERAIEIVKEEGGVVTE